MQLTPTDPNRGLQNKTIVINEKTEGILETIDLLQMALDKNDHPSFDKIMDARWDISLDFNTRIRAVRKKSNNLFLFVYAYLMEGVHNKEFKMIADFSVFYLLYNCDDDKDDENFFENLSFNNDEASKRFISAFVSGKCNENIILQCSEPLFLDQQIKGPNLSGEFTPLEYEFLVVIDRNYAEVKIAMLRNIWLNIFNRIDPFLEGDEEIFGKIFDDLFAKIREANEATKEDKYKFCFHMNIYIYPLGEGSRSWHSYLVEITEELLPDLMATEASMKRLLILAGVTKDPEFMITIDLLIKSKVDRSEYSRVMMECKSIFPKLFDYHPQIPFDQTYVKSLQNLTLNFV